MSQKAFTLIELLVAMVICILILGFVYFTYTGILFDFKNITKQASTQMQTIPTLNILRLDLEHAGYGIASNCDNKTVEWDNSTKTLTIRSTINNTNDRTVGWQLVSCKDPGHPLCLYKYLLFHGSSHVKWTWLNAKDGTWVNAADVTSACDKIGSDGTLLGFPYDDRDNKTCSTSSGAQPCYIIKYKLSSKTNGDSSYTRRVATCNKHTRNLLRVVNSGNGTPVLNCVADFEAKVDYDNSTTPKPKLVTVWIVYQVGQKDKNYHFEHSTLRDSETGKTFHLPSGYEHYHWKLIKLVVKPMAVYRSLP